MVGMASLYLLDEIAFKSFYWFLQLEFSLSIAYLLDGVFYIFIIFWDIFEFRKELGIVEAKPWDPAGKLVL